MAFDLMCHRVDASLSEAQLTLLGELMYQSHASYSAVKLGSSATDQIVQLVRALGPASGLYGAKITGGGSGGTVCVLGEAGAAAEAAFARVLQRYRETSGHEPYVVEGSSAGALQFWTRGGAAEAALKWGEMQGLCPISPPRASLQKARL